MHDRSRMYVIPNIYHSNITPHIRCDTMRSMKMENLDCVVMDCKLFIRFRFRFSHFLRLLLLFVYRDIFFFISGAAWKTNTNTCTLIVRVLFQSYHRIGLLSSLVMFGTIFPRFGFVIYRMCCCTSPVITFSFSLIFRIVRLPHRSISMPLFRCVPWFRSHSPCIVLHIILIKLILIAEIFVL